MEQPGSLSLCAAVRRFGPLLNGIRWRLAVAILCYLLHAATTVVTVAVFELALIGTLGLTDQNPSFAW